MSKSTTVAFLGLIVIGLSTIQAQTNTFPGTGNVGIGTTSPSNLLTISNNLGSGNIVNVTNTAGGEASIIYGSSGQPSWVAGNGAWGVSGDYVIGGGTVWGPKVVINPSGRVGIGTQSPGYALELDNTPSSDIPIGVFSNLLSPGSGNQTHGFTVLSPNAVGSGNLDSVIEAGTSRTALNVGYMAFVSKGAGSSNNFLTFGIAGKDELLNITPSGNVGGITAYLYPRLESTRTPRAPESLVEPMLHAVLPGERFVRTHTISALI